MLLAATPVTGAYAQATPVANMSIEELMRINVEAVFGASKRMQPVTEAPASITIVTANEIARYGYQTLADVLRGVRGFYVVNDRNYSWLGQRGFLRPGDFNTHVLLLVDGHRINDNIFDQAAIGRDVGVDASMFQRVEIIRGPMSSLYGANAFFAVVNVIMRNGSDLNGVTAGGDVGTFGARSGHLAAGKKLANGLDFSLSGSYSGTNGAAKLYVPAFDTPQTNGGIAEHLDDEQSGQIFGRVKFGPVAVTAAYGSRVKGVPTASYGSVFNDARLRTTDHHGFIDAHYGRTVKGSEVVVRASLDHYHYAGLYPLEATPDQPVSAYYDYTFGTWTAVEARMTRNLPGRQAVTIGGEFRDYLTQMQGATVDGSQKDGFLIDSSSRLGAGYLQDEVRILPALRVSWGARYDVYAGFSRVTPRAALIVESSSRQSFKYLYGTAFRAPNAFEYDFYSEGVRNQGLRPETLTSHELVWERYTSTWLRTSASAYRNRVAKVLTLVDSPSATFGLGWENHGRIHSAGLELEGEWRFKHIEGLGSYAVQRSTDPDTDAALTNSPSHVAKLRFSVPGPLLRGTIAFETQFLSRRKTLAGKSVAPSTIANLTIVEPVGRRLDFLAALRNVFDTPYAVPGSKEHRQDVIAQDGRTFTVGLRWRFPAK